MATKSNTSKKQVRQYVKELYGHTLASGNQFFEVRKINHKTGHVQSQFYKNLDSVFREIEEQEKGWDYYFGVHPRDKEDGSASAVTIVLCLYADLDFKNFENGQEGVQEILDFLGENNLPPTVVIETGNGVHTYWFLNEAESVKDPSSYCRILQAVQTILGSDPIHDLPRIMRVPGTQNYKDPKNPKTCKIISADYSRRYSLADFETFIHDSGDETQTQEDTGEGEIREGKRNNTLTSMAGSMRRPGMTEDEINAALNQVNRDRCNPPLPETEILKISKSVAKYPTVSSGRIGKSSMADQLVDMALQEDIEFCHDGISTPYARFQIEDHYELWPCRSRVFKRFLSRLCWTEQRKAPGSDAINSALNTLEAKAVFSGSLIEVHNRVARLGDEYYYDLSDQEWRTIKITANGWNIVSDPPVRFRRHAHQAPQVEPTPGGDLRQLGQFLNLRYPSQEILLEVYLVSCLIPDIPHAVPIVYGPPGSAKTTLLRIMRRLIDPSQTETLSLSWSKDEVIQQMSHHWAPYYDNISSIKEWTSDVLCRAVTGEGASKRQLWTDDEDIIYNFRRCVALNGINVVATEPDLLDRGILFELEQISDVDRMDEATFWEDFEEIRPKLFGAMLDALSKAISLRPSIKLDRSPRLADFAIWGCAIAEALGYERQDFLNAFDKNIAMRNEEAIASSLVGAALLEFMEGKDRWEGETAVLLKNLEEMVPEKIQRSKLWPKASHMLTRRLNEIKTNLLAVGIAITTGERDNKKRHLTIEREVTNRH